MKKFSSVLLLFFFFAAFTSYAQESKLTTGVIAYDQMRYEEAIDKIKEAMTKPELLKPKSKAKGYYYLTQSFYKILTTESMMAQLGAKYPDLENQTYEAFKNAMENLPNAGGDKTTFTTGLEFIKQNLFVVFLNKGSQLYSSVKDEDAVAATKLKEAAGYLTKAMEINPDNYMPTLALGFIGLRSNDNTMAIDNLEKSLKVYEDKSKTAKMDSVMANAYINLSNLYLDQKNTAKALEVVERGKKSFPGHSDIGRQELAVYQGDPTYLEQALSKFDESLKKNPKDEAVRIAYAEMLMKAGKTDLGVAEYKKVLETNPGNKFANLNLGAHYVNTAAEINEKLKTASNDDYEVLNKQIIENFKLAYPFIKKVQQLEPKNIEWVNQMIQITSYLMIDDDNMEKEMNTYDQLKKELQK